MGNETCGCGGESSSSYGDDNETLTKYEKRNTRKFARERRLVDRTTQMDQAEAARESIRTQLLEYVLEVLNRHSTIRITQEIINEVGERYATAYPEIFQEWSNGILEHQQRLEEQRRGRHIDGEFGDAGGFEDMERNNNTPEIPSRTPSPSDYQTPDLRTNRTNNANMPILPNRDGNRNNGPALFRVTDTPGGAVRAEEARRARLAALRGFELSDGEEEEKQNDSEEEEPRVTHEEEEEDEEENDNPNTPKRQRM